MPKEKLNYDRVLVHRREDNLVQSVVKLPDEDLAGALPDGSYHEQVLLVELHWSPDAYAQYSVTLDRAKVEEQLLEQSGATLVLYGECLERREMNGAVRALRRARNTVHGADE